MKENLKNYEPLEKKVENKKQLEYCPVCEAECALVASTLHEKLTCFGCHDEEVMP